MIFKNLNGDSVSVLEDWEKVIIVQHLATFGYPSWATGQNFARLLQVLLDFSHEQSDAAIARADTERGSIRKQCEETLPDTIEKE